jgi:hypothetical protein
VSSDLGVAFLFELQDKLAALDYSPCDVSTTVSIGASYVGADCFLSEREILALANLAKNQAKKAGKDCVALGQSKVGQEAAYQVLRRVNRRTE